MSSISLSSFSLDFLFDSIAFKSSLFNSSPFFFFSLAFLTFSELKTSECFSLAASTFLEAASSITSAEESSVIGSFSEVSFFVALEVLLFFIL
tara:strand:- start:635 stop:913 length:279 start_codon:yes stop_codon:yes gene_type:complete